MTMPGPPLLASPTQPLPPKEVMEAVEWVEAWLRRAGALREAGEVADARRIVEARRLVSR